MSRYIVRRPNGSTEGPYTSAELRTLAYEGQLSAQDQISPLGETRWVSAGKVGGIKEILELLSPPAAPDTASTTEASPASPPPPPGSEAPRTAPSPPVSAGISLGADDFGTADPAPAASSFTPPPPSNPRGSVGGPTAPSTPAAVGHGPGAEPGGAGFSDRVLRGAFRFARGISVLVILVCTLALVGSALLATYGMMPVVPKPEIDGVETPELDEFVVVCTPAPLERDDGSAPPEREEQRRAVRTRNDPCAEYRSEFEFVIRTMQLPAAAEDALCRTVLDLPSEYREQFMQGLRQLAEQYRARQPRGEDCSPVDAANWYIQSFKERIAAEQAARQLAELKAAEERARRWQQVLLSAAVAGGAIIVLLAFLFLPLLIQIERNTRRFAMS